MNKTQLADVYAVYGGSDRHYHGLNHLAHCFSDLSNVWDLLEDPEAVAFALYYHDYVYDPARTDNEERSAEIAYQEALNYKHVRCYLRHFLSPMIFADKVKRLVLVTTHDRIHYPADTIDEKFICDVDLSSLGSSPEEFARNSDLIRKEYLATVPDEEAFKVGRKAFMQKFLEQPFIFYTDYFRNKYEEKALANLKSL